MADEATATPPAPVPPAVEPAAAAAAPPAVEGAPPAAEPAAAPAVPVAPEVAEPVAAEPAAPAAKPAEAAAPKPPASLLAEAGKEAPPAPDAAPAAPGAAEAPALPAFDTFKLPEGMSAGGQGLGEFTTALGQFERETGIDHRLVEEFGQKALDLYAADMRRFIERQQQGFTETRQNWVKAIKDDPVLGRNRHETVMRDAARVRDLFATDRFREMIDLTGAGDHPGMLDFVHNVARFLDRHGLLREGTPVAAPKPAALPQPRTSRSRYTSSQGAS